MSVTTTPTASIFVDATNATMRPPEASSSGDGLLAGPSTTIASAVSSLLGTDGNGVAIKIGTQQYANQTNSEEEDWAIITSGLWTVAIVILCFGYYLFARHSAFLMRNIYAPLSSEVDARGAAGFPGWFGWLTELRQDAAAVLAGEVGLEQAMVLRFIRLNLRLLCYAFFICW